MRRRKSSQPEAPGLPERVLSSDCRRVAVVGLHRGAGARTVLQCVATELRVRDVGVGVARVPRVALDDDEAAADAARRVVLPAGTWVATLCSLAAGEPALEPVDGSGAETGGTPVGIYRVVETAPVPVQGPEDPGAMTEAVERLAERAGGRVLVGAPWERRAVAAPGVTDALILAVGSGYARSPEHSAAAVRYTIDTLAAPACDGRSQGAWHDASTTGTVVVLDAKGRRLGGLRADPSPPVPALEGLAGGPPAVVALPEGLHDPFLAPLVRSTLRFCIVVRDPTRIQASPVWLEAWHKGGGRVEVVLRTRLLAVATNPANPTGPDAEPREFRRRVSEAATDLPVHDVRLESNDSNRRRWKLWSGS